MTTIQNSLAGSFSVGIGGGRTGAVQAQIESQIGSIRGLMAQLDAILAEIAALQPPGKNPDDPEGYEKALQAFQRQLQALNAKLLAVQYKMSRAQQILSRLQSQDLPKAQKEEVDRLKALFDEAKKRLDQEAKKRREMLRQKDLPRSLPVVADRRETINYRPDPNNPANEYEYEAIQFRWMPAGELEPKPAPKQTISALNNPVLPLGGEPEPVTTPLTPAHSNPQAPADDPPHVSHPEPIDPAPVDTAPIDPTGVEPPQETEPEPKPKPKPRPGSIDPAPIDQGGPNGSGVHGSPVSPGSTDPDRGPNNNPGVHGGG